MGSSCSSSQSAKDSTSVRSEDLAMDTTSPPEKTKAEPPAKETIVERKVSDIRPKGPSLIESEYSSVCDDGMPTSPPGAFSPSISRTGDSSAPPADLPSLISLPPYLRRLLEGAVEEGDCERDKKETVRARYVTLYVCAASDSYLVLSLFISRVLPGLRVLARSLGWELRTVLSPLASASNCGSDGTQLISERDVICVANAGLCGLHSSSPVIPLVFLHEHLGSPVFPSVLQPQQYADLLEALDAALPPQEAEAHKAVLDKWYAKRGSTAGADEASGGDEGGAAEDYCLVPPASIYPNYHSSDLGELQEVRALFRQEGEALLRHVTSGGGGMTALETEVSRVLSHECASSAVWVSTQHEGRPLPEEGLDRVQELHSRLESSVHPSSILRSVTSWSAEEEGAADPQHLSQLCTQLGTLLSSRINTISSKRKSLVEKCRSIPHGVLYDLQEHQQHYRRLLNSTTPRKRLQQDIQKYLDDPQCRGPLVLVGSTGSGLTTEVVHAAQRARDQRPGLIVLSRSVGVSAECSTADATVRALARHCAALYGGSDGGCTKGHHQIRHLLRKCASGATSVRSLLLILDGTCSSSSSAITTALPLPLPEHVKLILTCSRSADQRGCDVARGDLEEKLRRLCSEDGALIEMPPLESLDLPVNITSLLCHSDCCRRAGGRMWRDLRERLSPSITPLHIQIIVRSWQLSPEGALPTVQDTLDLQTDAYAERLEHLFGKVLVHHALGYLCASVRGLASSEMEDLLSCDPEVMVEYFALAQHPSEVRRFPSSTWHRLLHALEPFVHTVVVSGNPLLYWRHSAMANKMAARYLPSQDVIRNRCSAVVLYFQGKYSNGEELQDKHTDASTDRCCIAQPITYQTISETLSTSSSDGSHTQPCVTINHVPKCCSAYKTCGAKCVAANTRRVDEEPRAVFRSCSPAVLDQMIEKFTLDHEWLLKKLAASTTEQVVGDIEAAMLLCKDSLKPDLDYLRIALELSADSLDYDHRQFYAQMYGRLHDHVSNLPAFECCHLRKLLAVCVRPPLHTWLPQTQCFVPPAQANSEDPVTSTEVVISQVSRLPVNPRHLVAMSTVRGTLQVWDVANKRPVRTLKGLHLPRKFKMIDDFQCLLLCGRELRIYNLDTGELVIKFREVMNQKMPFFGLNRPDHVVALSRSRMYVNMMTVTNGECVATFKVGEDRFLNSLMVSENGRTCVCGDDTPKASALLVWDLCQRKLMYDLRIPHHEFLTSMAAITSEGHYVACVCRETEEQTPNFLVVYDLESGTLFKRWKPGVSSLGLAISTPGVSVVAALKDGTVTAYDLVTGNPRWLVRGHSHPADTIRLAPNGSFVLTYDSSGRDRAVRTWDMQTGAALTVWTPDSPVTACAVCSDSRAVAVALAGRVDLITVVMAYSGLPPQGGGDDGASRGEDEPYGAEERRGMEFDLG